jgi:hypothetical protein
VRGLIVGYVLCAVLALPSVASADVWVGKTNQGFRGVVETNPDGSIARVLIKWRARCERRGFQLGPTATRWRTTPENPIERSGNVFSDSGPYPDPGDRYDYVGTQTLSGRFLANGRVAVKQVTQVEVQRRGRRIDACASTARFTGVKR